MLFITTIVIYWHNKQMIKASNNQMLKTYKEYVFCKKYTFLSENDIINFQFDNIKKK